MGGIFLSESGFTGFEDLQDGNFKEFQEGRNYYIFYVLVTAKVNVK
jgi:hypothetical protein